jgi:predicted RNase H-like HicB family nuclease
MKKVYPAIFHKDEDSFWVEFPDLPGCLTDGQTIDETISNAEEVLGLYIACRMEDNLDISAPSDIEDLQFDEGYSTYISTDVDKYHKKKKAVKKTLSIPQWLAEEAERQHISFSALLQSALKRELNLD